MRWPSPRAGDLPVTVFLGGPPALILAAIAPLPENVPELMLASLIAGGKIGQCRARMAESLIANAEIALCGRVPAGVRRPEGPFGDHYGYYSLRHDYPVFEVEYVARRRDAVFPATVVGKPTAGGLLHRRSAAGSAVAALSRWSCPVSSRCGRTAKPGTTHWPERWSGNGIGEKPWRRPSGSSARASSA